MILQLDIDFMFCVVGAKWKCIFYTQQTNIYKHTHTDISIYMDMYLHLHLVMQTFGAVIRQVSGDFSHIPWEFHTRRHEYSRRELACIPEILAFYSQLPSMMCMESNTMLSDFLDFHFHFIVVLPARGPPHLVFQQLA